MKFSLVMGACCKKMSLVFIFTNLKDGASEYRCIFAKELDYGEKVDLSKRYWNPKRKMWVTMHFQR